MQEENKAEGCNISISEWYLVIAILGLIDLIQIGVEWFLDWLGVGVLINWGIDIVVGMSLPLYLKMRGVSFSDPKRLFGFITAFVGEFIPIVDELPLWCLDGFYNMILCRPDLLVRFSGGSPLIAGIGKGLEKLQKREEKKELKTPEAKQPQRLPQNVIGGNFGKNQSAGGPNNANFTSKENAIKARERLEEEKKSGGRSRTGYDMRLDEATNLRSERLEAMRSAGGDSGIEDSENNNSRNVRGVVKRKSGMDPESDAVDTLYWEGKKAA